MIKFRGNRVDNGEEVFGWYAEQYDAVYEVRKSLIWPLESEWHCVRVIPETVAQYTGLNDKKDVEIYGSIEINGEMSKGGDRFKQADGRIGTIVFFNATYWIGNKEGAVELNLEAALGEVIGRQYEKKESQNGL